MGPHARRPGRWCADPDPPDAARFEPDSRALNTGLLCREVAAFDVDVLDPALVNRIGARIERALGLTPLVRIGRAPKTLLVYRLSRPFAKVQTPELFFPDGSKAKVELLADGQQFVAAGIHPDKGAPYRWTGATPADVPRRSLPIVTEQQARAIVAAAEELLRSAGAAEKQKSQPERKKPNGQAGDFFAQVNTAALTGIRTWARYLFPKARFEPGTGAWRVSSKDLGRDFEEDISIHPEGIRDVGEEVRLSAVDLVLRHGIVASTPVEAALWVCERLRIDPEAFGYHGKPKPAPRPEPEPPEPEPQPSDDPIAELNQTFAVIRVVNPAAILNEHLDAEGLPTFSMLAPESFRLLLANRKIEIETADKDGNKVVKPVPLAPYWITHPPTGNTKGSPSPRKVPRRAISTCGTDFP